MISISYNNTGHDVAKSSARVIAKTPLAAAIVPKSEADAADRRIVLYFIDAEETKKKYLASANATLGQKVVTFDLETELPKVLEIEGSKQNLLEWAGMSAYVDVPRQQNVLYALTTKNTGQEAMFKAMSHPWSSVKM